MNKGEISRIVFENFKRDSVLNRDEANHYRAVGREFTRHDKMLHAYEKYVRDDAHG
jgi:hypothetical protein